MTKIENMSAKKAVNTAIEQLHGNYVNKLFGILKDLIVPLLVGSMVFWPNIYDSLQASDTHYIWNIFYFRNPVEIAKRQLTQFLSQVDQSGIKISESEFLLSKIAHEMSGYLPAILGSQNIKPFDRVRVRIINVSNVDLRNIRVSLENCEASSL